MVSAASFSLALRKLAFSQQVSMPPMSGFSPLQGLRVTCFLIADGENERHECWFMAKPNVIKPYAHSQGQRRLGNVLQEGKEMSLVAASLCLDNGGWRNGWSYGERVDE